MKHAIILTKRPQIKMETNVIAKEVLAWHHILDKTSKCVAVAVGLFQRTFQLILISGEVRLAEYSRTTIVSVSVLPGIAQYAMDDTVYWYLCVDNRNNAYVITRSLHVIAINYYEYRTQATWSKTYIADQWTSLGAAAEGELFVAASFTGEMKMADKKFFGDSVVFALTRNGELLFDHKVLMDSATLTLAPSPVSALLVVGVIDGGEIALQEFSKTGAVGTTTKTTDLAVHNVLSAVLLPSGVLAVAGQVYVENKLFVYHITVQTTDEGEICKVATIPTSDSDIAVQLLAVGQRAIMHLQLEDQGSWIFDGRLAVHHFSDQLVRGWPLISYVEDMISGILLVKGGEMMGDLYIDKRLYDVGGSSPLSYVMQFISARVANPRPEIL
jgi:hypothetical protein